MAGNPEPFGPDTPESVDAPEDINVLVGAYADARNIREEADDRAKRLREIEMALEVRLFDEMERLNLRSVRHARGLFSLNDLAWASVVDEALVRAWAENEMPEILLPNASRLAVVVRQALKGERDSMPPGVEPRFSRKINWRRS